MIAFIKRYEGLWLFTRSPAAIIAAVVALLSIMGAAFAPLIASVNPYDLASFSLMDGLLPPMWEEFGIPKFPLGTDDQGRDMVSSILYGARLSLIIGLSAMTIATVLGVGLGLAAGYYGGRFDMIVMRFADIQLALPAILTVPADRRYCAWHPSIGNPARPSGCRSNPRHRPIALGEFRTNRTSLNFRADAKGICSGRDYNGAASDPCNVCAYPSQHSWSAIGNNDRRFGLCHITRSDTFIPWDRTAGRQPVTGNPDPHRYAVHVVGRMVDPLDSDPVFGGVGGVNQHPWGFPARCL
jgi:hypothetical protein